MDPVTILELTGTVISLSIKVYDFFKAVHDAPDDIQEYLHVLEQTRGVFQDTQDYCRRYISSSFHTNDGMELSIVQRTLEDCKLEFALQLSFIESLDPSSVSSFFRKAVRKTKFVLSEEKIEAFTQKLEKAQGLLSVAIATSTGKNTVLIRDKLEIVSFEVHEANERSKAESVARDQLLQQIQQYVVVMQDSAKEFLQNAKDTHIRSDTRLSDLSQSLVAADASLTTPSFDVNSGGEETEAIRQAQPKLSPATLERLEQSRAEFDRFVKSSRFSSANSSRFSPAKGSHFTSEESTSSILDGTMTWEDILRPAESRMTKANKSRLAGWADNLRSLTISGTFGGSPEYDALMSGSLKIIVSAVAQHEEGMTIVFEAMQEMSEAIELCTREHALYQDPKLTSLIEKLYLEALDITKILMTYYEKKKSSRLLSAINERDIPQLESATARIRRISEAVLREVDYQHRLEMRRTSNRIVEMQVEQRRMMGMLEDQKRILQGMEEERKIMGVIQGQQEILQVVQQIQLRLQAEAGKR